MKKAGNGSILMLLLGIKNNCKWRDIIMEIFIAFFSGFCFVISGIVVYKQLKKEFDK